MQYIEFVQQSLQYLTCYEWHNIGYQIIIGSYPIKKYEIKRLRQALNIPVIFLSAMNWIHSIQYIFYSIEDVRNIRFYILYYVILLLCVSIHPRNWKISCGSVRASSRTGSISLLQCPSQRAWLILLALPLHLPDGVHQQHHGGFCSAPGLEQFVCF